MKRKKKPGFMPSNSGELKGDHVPRTMRTWSNNTCAYSYPKYASFGDCVSSFVQDSRQSNWKESLLEEQGSKSEDPHSGRA